MKGKTIKVTVSYRWKTDDFKVEITGAYAAQIDPFVIEAGDAETLANALKAGWEQRNTMNNSCISIESDLPEEHDVSADEPIALDAKADSIVSSASADSSSSTP